MQKKNPQKTTRPSTQNKILAVLIAVVMVDFYLNHVYMDLGEQVMFTLQKHALLLLLLCFITLELFA